ncbi:MAG: glycosyltransferase [Agriterribacter sp.]
MKNIILDCDLMRYRNSTLHHYCLNTGLNINRLQQKTGKLPVRMYVPPAEKNSFGNLSYTIIEKKWHKLWKPFLWNCRVWHAPFQSGRILPDKEQHPGIKVLLTIHDLNALHEGKSLKAQHRNIAHTQSLINRSDAIVCISEFTKSDVTKHCDTGSKPAYVIHNGVHKVSTPGAAPASVFKDGMQRFAGKICLR